MKQYKNNENTKKQKYNNIKEVPVNEISNSDMIEYIKSFKSENEKYDLEQIKESVEPNEKD